MTRIQVKKYYKGYMTQRKAAYRYRTYYIYLPRRIAEPLIGKDLRISTTPSGILIEPIQTIHRSQDIEMRFADIRGMPSKSSTVERILA